MKKIFSAGLLSIALTAGMSTSANAALANNSILNFNPGVSVSSASGAVSVSSGSYFGLDINGNGLVGSTERTAISQNEGLIIGQAQSLPLLPVPGVQVSVIDVWDLTGGTAEGTHWTSSPANILTDNGAGNVTIDLSGLTLNAGGQNVFLEGPGVAQITCIIDCSDGDSYTLDFSAAIGSTSAFAGLLYNFHLEGVISTVPVPAAVWLFGSGLLGLAGVARRRKAV